MKTNSQHRRALLTEWGNIKKECAEVEKQLNAEDEKLQEIYDVENAAVFGGHDMQTRNIIAQQSAIVSNLNEKLSKLQKAKGEAHSEIGNFTSSIAIDKWGDEYKEQ